MTGPQGYGSPETAGTALLNTQPDSSSTSYTDPNSGGGHAQRLFKGEGYEAPMLQHVGHHQEIGSDFSHEPGDLLKADQVFHNQEPTMVIVAEEDEELVKEEKRRFKKQQKAAMLSGPLRHKFNLYPIFLFFWFLGGAGYYFYVRINELHGSKYSTFILAIELLGVTSFLPYAILLTRGIYPTGSPGLPPASDDPYPTMKGDHKSPMLLGMQQQGSFKHQQFGALPENQALMHGDMRERFHVRVMVPCYKEPFEVVAATVNAARDAYLPANTKRTIYLCDDGNSADKKAWVETLGPDVVYVSGRKRKTGEINGKSANLNNCLKNVIYANYPKDEDGDIDWTEISNREILVVFDADMCAKPEFFLRMLEVMSNDDYALCLSPQSFHNISRDADLFNNINKQFWECWLPGAFAWGYIACTGTNFCLRARALAHCGWFPDYTITEDYALGMELKTRGYKATYLMLYLAVGEAPDEIRNVFRQRSRWQKGHFQVFFSLRCPLFNFSLPFFQRLWYSYAAWAPICTVITIPSFMAVPFLSIAFGINPVTITFHFVLAATIFYTSQALIQNYAYAWGDWKLMWFANGSNIVLWFTYFKALFNSLIAKMGMKVVAFKVTEKKQTTEGAAAAAAMQRQPTFMQRMQQGLTKAFSGRRKGDQLLLTHREDSSQHMSRPNLPTSLNPPGPLPSDEPHAIATVKVLPRSNSHPDKIPRLQSVKLSHNVHIPVVSGGNAHVRGAAPLPATEAGKRGGWDRFKAVIRSFKPAHIKEFDEMFDPLVLLLLFLFSAATFGFGLWQTIRNFDQRASVTFAFDSPIKGSPYLIISTMWAFFNMIFPYLFLHYAFTAGGTFKFAANTLMLMSHLIMITSIVVVWLLIPSEFDVGIPLDLQVNGFLTKNVAPGNNTLIPNFRLNNNNFSFAAVFEPGFSVAVENEMRTFTPAPAPARRLHAEMDRMYGRYDRDFDPAALGHADLNADTSMAAWQRSLLQAGDKAAAAVESLPPELKLGGGLLVKDHVKYAQPMAYTITQMSWALLQYPNGFNDGQKETLRNTIRSTSEYLIRCLWSKKQGTFKKVPWAFVAQVGDPSKYIAVPNMTPSPASAGKIWTSPEQDPFLNGKEPVQIHILDEDHVGSDLLADVAAALAATSMVFKDTDPPFSGLALGRAKKVYELASVGADNGRPKSYCDFIPCTAEVEVTSYRKTVPVSSVLQPIEPTRKPGEAMCYFASFNNPKTCLAGNTVKDCEDYRQRGNVFKTQDACCGFMSKANAWSGLSISNPVQGICALPPGQTNCFVPRVEQRQCFEESFNATTGLNDKKQPACSGVAVEVLPSVESCCNFISLKLGANDLQPLAGICAPIRNNADKNVTCYQPVLSTPDCVKQTSFAECTARQIPHFENPIACCNFLVGAIGSKNVSETGLCHGLGVVSQGIQPSANPVPAVPAAGRRLRQKKDSLIPIPGTNLSVDNNTLWYPPVPPPALDVPCTPQNGCAERLITQKINVTFYNSTSTLDDMAWGGVWLFKASGDQAFLGKAQRYLERHYKEDITVHDLNNDRSYYVSDWNNVAWGTNMLLLQETHRDIYDAKMRLVLDSWVRQVQVPTQLGGVPSASPVNITIQNTPTMWNDTNGNGYYVLPTCIATHTTEICDNGIDDDCDGAIDKFDSDCSLFPMLYTSKNLAYSVAPSLPHAAGMAWLSLLYSEQRDARTAQRLRCWALGQVAYIMGATPGTKSYIVGYGGNAGIARHRASSCPKPDKATTCDWDNAYYPQVPNPQSELINGALLAGPDFNDQFVESRENNQTDVSLDATVQLTGVLAGLQQTGTKLRNCELMQGVYQKIFGSSEAL